MIGMILVDEKDISDDGYVILEYPIEPKNNCMQTCVRVQTNIKFIECRTDLWDGRHKG